MSSFEFVFTLLGLLLGLALAEGLGGLSRAIKASHNFKIGWPTILLGLFVSCDVVTFWMYGWALRDKTPVSWPYMFGGFVVTAIYFVSASLVFPDDNWDDTDAHFQRHYRKVLGGIFICNVVMFAFVISVMGIPAFNSLRALIIVWSFFPIALLGLLVRDRRVLLACLTWLISLYPLSAIW
jgi:hypothetical protein